MRKRRKRKIRKKADGRNCGMKGGRESTLQKGRGRVEKEEEEKD